MCDIIEKDKKKICSKGDFMEPINETQKRIYEFLVERSQDGVPPSVREIGAAVGLKSTSSVQANLDALEKAGYIMRDPLLKRSIRILGQAENVTDVSARSCVSAGSADRGFYGLFAGRCGVRHLNV